jgi:putrescine aminotransferase
LKGEPKRKTFISRRNAYHGSTVASASLGGMSYMHVQGDLPIPGVEHVMQPYLFGDGFGEDAEAFGARAAQEIEDRILAIGPENIAAFIGEPVQGAGGVIIPPDGYWKRVEAICRKYGILLVSDEVICGFGRLGEWFGFQKFGVTPDIVSMAKGLSSGYLPISATAVSSRIVETLRTVDEDFVHGYTYSGHPVAAAVALRNLEIIEREKLVDRVRSDVGPYFAEALKRLDAHPLVGEARSLGLIGAVEIVAEKGTNRRFGGKEGIAGPMVRDACIAGGLMVRAVRDSVVMCPPFIITHEEIDRMISIIAAALDEVEGTLRAIDMPVLEGAGQGL